MNRIIIVLAILAVFSAVIIHQVHNRLYGIPIPDGLNPNSTFAYRVVGFVMNFAGDLCNLGWQWGLVDNYHVSLRHTLNFFARITRLDAFKNQLEINNTEIFGTRVRIYRPVNKTEGKDENNMEEQEKELLPAVIYYHGGGWTIGGLDVYDAFCRRMAVTAQVVVVSADYSLAPEYLYPTAFNECYNVAVGLLNTGSQYGVDVKRVMVAGDSAGGNLAAAVAHYLAYVGEKHCRKQYLAGQILIYPCLQMLDFSLPSFKNNEVGVTVNRRGIVEYVSLYLTGNLDLVDAMLEGNHSRHLENTTFMSYVKGTALNNSISSEESSDIEDASNIKKPFIDLSDLAAEALTHFKGSPLMASNFRGIPSTFLITAEFDPLKDEGFLYANRLRNEGINVVHKHYNSFHGFVTITSEPWPYSPYGTQEAMQAMQDIVACINRMKTTSRNPEEEKEDENEDGNEDS